LDNFLFLFGNGSSNNNKKCFACLEEHIAE
jgi:hypothetical protein